LQGCYFRLYCNLLMTNHIHAKTQPCPGLAKSLYGVDHCHGLKIK